MKEEGDPTGRMFPDPGAKSTAVLAVDTGGTFTDLLLLGIDGSLEALKVPSTPRDPAVAVLEGMARLLGGGEEWPATGLRLLVHGSTVATNALLERKGARVFLVTNRGFEDVIEIGRQNRPQLYALTGRRPSPLVAREDRIGIGGRLGPDGSELEPLDPEELAGLPARLGAAEAVAVVLLHSYGYPDHEEEVARALDALPVPVSVSSRILAEFREYERTSTTVVNAYVAPRMEGYLRRLAGEAPAGTIRIMGSGGGALPLERAAAEPVHTVLSGPAGGVVAALDWARRVGAKRVLSFDMGGTSTDVALVPGELLRTREGSVGGLPVAIPLLDIHTVGAGGGSLARIDPGGALRVGPESSGADPGPVVYGRGGEGITVTDAHVLLGRLPPEGFLGGEGTLDADALAAPFQKLSREADRSPLELAEGILEVVNTAMEGALRVISVERGVDPADHHLVAFGGAAGLHAAELTERLGLEGAILPPDPGLLSAFGMLVAPVIRSLSRTVLLTSDDPSTDEQIREVLGELEAAGREEMAAEGIVGSSVTAHLSVDARYRGQSFELEVPARDWTEAFHRAHEVRYGYRKAGAVVEAVTLRARLEAPGESVPVPGIPSGSGLVRARRTTAVLGGREVEARLIRRGDLGAGDRVEGPAVILEYSSTTWCPPGWLVEAHPSGALLIRRA
jgi:N-methylhydantoinase A